MVNKNLLNRDFFLIAEAGINHNGDINKAIKLVDAAKKSGASAINLYYWETSKKN